MSRFRRCFTSNISKLRENKECRIFLSTLALRLNGARKKEARVIRIAIEH